MRLRYIGPKPLPRHLTTPIPFVAHSERIGELIFNPECEVPNDEWAAFLLEECGGSFELAEEAAPSVASSPDRSTDESDLDLGLDKVFGGRAGKWKAKAYVKRHQLDGLVEYVKTPDGWRLVPIAAAHAGTHAPVTV